MGSGSSSRNTVPTDERGSGSRSINAGSVEGRDTGSKYINAGSVEGRDSGSKYINAGSNEGRSSGSGFINAGSVGGRGSGSRSINAGSDEGICSGSRFLNAGSNEGRSSGSGFINAGSVGGRGSGSRSINAGSDEGICSGSRFLNVGSDEGRGLESRSINVGSVEGRDSGSRSIKAESVEGRGPGSNSINAGSDGGMGSGSRSKGTGSRSINPGSEEISQNSCDVCLTQKRAPEAKSYCVVCNEHLCQRCEQAHRGSKSSRSHTILTGSSIPSGSTKKKQIMFGESHKTSLIGMTVRAKQKQINLRSDSVWGCTFMPDGHLVVACDTDGLKLFDRAFKYHSELSVRSLDVAVINNSDGIVTQGGDKQLQRVQVLPTMAVKSTIQMDRKCFGVDVYGGEIYVTCYDGLDHGEVVVLDINGQIKKRLGFYKIMNYDYMFKLPFKVKVSKDGSKLFVSDWETHIVTCLNQQGHVIYRYSGRDLERPRGLYVDGEDNVLVCDSNCIFNNVYVIRRDGKRKRVLLSGKDGMWRPLGISYRQSDGYLVVVMGYGRDETKLVVFTTNKTKI